MKGKRLVPIAAAGILITHKASCERSNNDGFPFPPDIARGSSNPNETLYGPLKVIEFPGGNVSHPTKFTPYPDIDPTIREKISNGGLAITCSSCNATGCICPDAIANISSVCDFCRGTTDGGLRCYCSPALVAGACNTVKDKVWGCGGNHELCSKVPSIFFCEAQPWYQDPRLANISEQSYGTEFGRFQAWDFKELIFTPDSDITAWAQRGQDKEEALGPGNYSEPLGADTLKSTTKKKVPVVRDDDESKGSKSMVGAGVAAAAVAGGVAFLMLP
ncbi:MAG: hypothetical protein Q9169_006778 [Polycauliona sp. 2 TL-2023]